MALHLSNLSDHLLHTSRLLSTSSGYQATLSTLVFGTTLVHSTLPVTSRLKYAISLRNVLLNDVWTFGRLPGLFHLYARLHKTYAHPPRDPIIKVLVYAQIGAAMMFHGFEARGFLGRHGLTYGRRWFWCFALAGRFYMVQVLLELARLLRVRQLRWDEDLGADDVELEKTQSGIEESSVREVQSRSSSNQVVRAQSEELKRRWYWDFAANLACLPIALHWSYVDKLQSPVSGTVQGLAGLVPSWVMLVDAWSETA